MPSLGTEGSRQRRSMGRATALACAALFLAGLASAVSPLMLPAGLQSARCQAETVPWPTSDPDQYICQPVVEAAGEALSYLLDNMFEFDRGSNVHSLVGGVFNNTVNKSLSARQQCALLPPYALRSPRCSHAVVSAECSRQVSLGRRRPQGSFLRGCAAIRHHQ